MIDSKTSPDAKLLLHFSTIFQDNNQSNGYGIYFIDVNGQNVEKKHSWANIIEAQVVSIFHLFFYSMKFSMQFNCRAINNKK